MLGQVIGNFRVVQLLGEGGMGEVYAAEHVSIRTKVAIKLLKPELSTQEAHVARFFNEAVAASQIQHVGVVKISDVGNHAGRAYLVMEFLNGESLARRIEQRGAMPVAQVANIGRQISSVLDVMHAAGITHRDLKPDNVFLVPDSEIGERVKVLDFGIAKLTTSNMTATGGPMGTPAYMSPEQWQNPKSVDWRTDAYALGCLLFEAATGRPPFLFETFGEACAKHLGEKPVVMSSLVGGVPAAFDRLVAKLLAKDPTARPRSMRDVMDELAAIERAGGSSDRRVRAPKPVHAATTLGGAAAASIPGSMKRPGRMTLAISAVGVVAVAAVTVKLVGGAPSVSSAQAPPDAIAIAHQMPSTPLSPPDAGTSTIAQPSGSGAQASASFDQPKGSGSSVSSVKKTVRPSPSASSAAGPHAVYSFSDDDGGTPLGSDDDCDEVSCLVGHGSQRCCAKYPHEKPRASAGGSGLPEALDRGMISSVMMDVRGRVASCGARFPSAAGKVKVHVKVGGDGHVSSVAIEGTPDPSLGSCVQAAIQHAVFPMTQAGGSFGYPFIFP